MYKVLYCQQDLQVHDCSFYCLFLVSSNFFLVFDILSGVSEEFDSFPFFKNTLLVHHTMQIKTDSILKNISFINSSDKKHFHEYMQ